MNIAKKVFLRWCPSESLQMERMMSMGDKWGTELQQTCVTVFDTANFALAFVMAKENVAESRRILAVGHDPGPGGYRYQNAWHFGAADKAVISETYAEAPTVELLLLDALLSLGPEEQKQKAVQAEALEASLRKMLAEREEAIQASDETSVLFDAAKFFEIASWAPESRAKWNGLTPEEQAEWKAAWHADRERQEAELVAGLAAKQTGGGK